MKEIFKKNYKIENNIIKFKINDQTVKKVTEFYNEAPFPNYEKDDDKSSINYKGEKNVLAREFKKLTGFNKNVLEVGCGTGQLSIYLAIGNNNRVFALDPTLASINLGKNFSDKNKIDNIKFINADIFDDVFTDETFDFIWANGVLHHTKNAKQSFDILAKLLMVNRLHMGFSVSGVFRLFLFTIPFPIKIVNMVDDTNPIKYIKPFMSAFIIEYIKK